MTYNSQFAEAIERTERLGLGTIPYSPRGDRLLTPQALESLREVVAARLKGIPTDQWTDHCFAIHNSIAQAATEGLGVPAYLTIGDVRSEGKWLCNADEASIAELLKIGVQHGGAVRLHAWITLPTMEVIDLTLPTSIGILENIPDLVGSVIVKHVDDLTGGVSYRPLIVGNEFLRRIGALLEE